MSRFNQQVLPILRQMESKNLVVVETGTIRNTKLEYADGDGWSTLHLAKWNLGKNHQIYSIDLYTEVCERFLAENHLSDRIILKQGSSLDHLATFDQIDFAYLDSANDAQLILDEFQLVENRMSKGGVVVVDDVIMNSKDVVKGHLVVPYARKKYDVTLLNRQAVIRGF